MWTENKLVKVIVNGEENEDVAMMLGRSGDAFFPVAKTKRDLEVSRSLHASSDQLRSLNLKDGENQVSFVVESSLQGKQETKGRIFLYQHNAKFVITDIDGTVTKSDFRGNLLTPFGIPWF